MDTANQPEYIVEVRRDRRITTRLERTVGSPFVYRYGRSAAAQSERYVAYVLGYGRV